MPLILGEVKPPVSKEPIAAKPSLRFGGVLGINGPFYGKAQDSYLNFEANVPGAMPQLIEVPQSVFTPGIVVGLAASVPLKKNWSLGVDLLYVQKRGSNFSSTHSSVDRDTVNHPAQNVMEEFVSSANSLVVTKQIHYFEMPIYVDFSFRQRHHFLAGIRPGWLMAAADRITTNSQVVENTFLGANMALADVQVIENRVSESAIHHHRPHLSSFDLGLTAGYGLDVSKRLSFQLRYSFGLTDMTKGATFGGLFHRNSDLQLTARWYFVGCK